MRTGKIESNKLEKLHAIENAAYELFAKKGYQETSIDQIVRQANIAKGTFYLYFKDKDELLRHLVFQRSSGLIREALEQAASQQVSGHIDRFLFLADFVIEYLRQNQEVLKLISKNLTSSLLKRAIKDGENDEIRELLGMYIQDMSEDGYTPQEAYQLLFMVIELLSTMCYSSIILEQPDTIDQVKPMLLRTIRKMLTS